VSPGYPGAQTTSVVAAGGAGVAGVTGARDGVRARARAASRRTGVLRDTPGSPRGPNRIL
jgi:hypothetical protein